jgi:cell division protein FtsL
MLKLNLLLAIALVLCAVFAISARHQTRDMFIALQKEQARARALDIDWGRLLLEQSTWAMHTRVELVARNQLQMVVPDASRIHLVPVEGSVAQGGRP